MYGTSNSQFFITTFKAQSRPDTLKELTAVMTF